MTFFALVYRYFNVSTIVNLLKIQKKKGQCYIYIYMIEPQTFTLISPSVKIVG